jgi:hypothetical protein
MKVIIVYYIFINPDRYKAIVKGQLQDLIKSGLSFDKIYISICCEIPDLIEECKELINSLIKKEIVFSECFNNQYEYPGLLLLYDLCQQNPDDIFFYFHSKGMVFNNDSNERVEFERITLRATLHYWEKAIWVFENICNVNKIGLWPSEKGYIWVNFFYIRASYLNKPPIITSDRWWYEEYLGTLGNGNYLDCYSLMKNKIHGVNPDQIKDDYLDIQKIDQLFDNIPVDKLVDID